VSAATVADGLCTYFGGVYDTVTHTYRTPQITVAGMGGPIFRRAAPKRDDHTTDYSLTEPGLPVGCLVLVLLEQGEEQRVAVAGATSGLKHVRWQVRMHCFLRAQVEYAEDAQDAAYDLLEAIRTKLHADRTCGTGGFEAGYGLGFQVGEGGEPWIKWRLSPVVTNAKELSKQYVVVEFDADEYVQA
jgi:hypothetical protein